MTNIIKKAPKYIFGFTGVLATIIGIIRDGTIINSNLVHFGLITLLFTLHLFNSEEIEEIKK